jgi:acyl-CoA synthetase (AMP-forming)/AMP-acid ligase II
MNAQRAGRLRCILTQTLPVASRRPEYNGDHNEAHSVPEATRERLIVTPRSTAHSAGTCRANSTSAQRAAALVARSLALRALLRRRSGPTRSYTLLGPAAGREPAVERARALGIGRGDTVAIMLPQRPETVIAHCRVYQMGAIALPLSFLFGPEALEYRLNDSQRKVAIVDEASLPNLSVRERCRSCST